jgi:4-amino-4-deoxy-L-arabinose transferase-like glycosyltransferase
MYFGLFLAILTLFKLWLSRYLPLLGDEAYYSLWSKHPALSYVDHPPMIAWLHGFTNLLFRQSDFGIRCMAIALILLSTWLIYLTAKEAFGKKVAVASAVLFNLIPTYLAGGMFLTPEQPVIIFWLLSMYAAVKIIKTHETKYWYLLGIGLGLGMLSKYPMVLFLPGLFLFLLLSKENRYWLTKKEPYLAVILAFLIFSPVIAWNISHHFPSLAHHGARLGSPNYLNNILYFVVLQFIMFSPPLFIFTINKLFRFRTRLTPDVTRDATATFLLLISIFPFFVFTLVSPITLVGGHWTSIVYPGMIILLCHNLVAACPNPLRNLRIWLNLIVIILINVLFIGYYAFLYPIPEDLKGKAYTINQELPKYIQDAKVTYVFSNQMGVASLVAFYGKTEIYLPKGLWRQFDIWGQPELKKGDSILYFAFDEPGVEKKLKPLFESVKLDPQKRLFAKDSDIAIKTKVYVCRTARKTY